MMSRRFVANRSLASLDVSSQSIIDLAVCRWQALMGTPGFLVGFGFGLSPAFLADTRGVTIGLDLLAGVLSAGVVEPVEPPSRPHSPHRPKSASSGV